jgi:hypothetical protein
MVVGCEGVKLLHNVFIALHATAGVICFAAGVLCLGLDSPVRWRLSVYLGSLVGLLVFLVAAIALTWSRLDLAPRVIYSGLFALGLFMLWRALRARTRLAHRDAGWRPRYLDDIGFTLISLFDGFVIVLAIDLQAPGWLVAAIAVVGVAAGVLAMNRVKRRLT